MCFLVWARKRDTYSWALVSQELLATMLSQVSRADTRYQSMQLAAWPAWVLVGGNVVATVVAMMV